jgi:hypothetical protein
LIVFQMIDCFAAETWKICSEQRKTLDMIFAHCLQPRLLFAHCSIFKTHTLNH